MKQILALLGLSAILLFAVMGKSYAINDSICGAYGLNAEQIHTCIHAYLNYQKMNHDSNKSMQTKLDQNREQNRENQLLQNIGFYYNYTIEKPAIANSILYYDLSGKQWYDTKTKIDTNEMMKEIKNWKTYDHNIIPKYTSCPAWHICNNHFVSLNHTSISFPLKPEFKNNVSGFVNSTGIKNMQQYQAYITANKTR